MKIIQIFNRYLEPGGEQTSVERIARHLEQGGHEVQRFWRSSSEWHKPGAPAQWRQAMLIGNNRHVLRELRELHDMCEADVWLIHNVVPMISLGVYRLAMDLGVPVIQWLHNYRPLSISGSYSEDGFSYICECLGGGWRGSRIQTAILGYHLWRAKQRKYYQSLSLSVAVSAQMRSIFIENGWEASKIAYLHHAWDVGAVQSINKSGDYFLFLGRIIEEKGIRFLIDLFAEPEMRAQKLVICGTGQLMSELKSKSTDNVQWLGYVTGDDKKRLVRGAKAVLFPSIWPEPLSTVAYEAYEQCTTIVCAPSGGMPEIVQHEKTGALIALEPDEWKKCLLNLDLDRASQWGESGRQWLIENRQGDYWINTFNELANIALRRC